MVGEDGANINYCSVFKAFHRLTSSVGLLGCSREGSILQQ